MKAVGIIAEYNPCHNGHQYHIHQSKVETGADCAVVVMSGDFVQRGAPAIADKYTRAKCAVICGADIVIELPVVYATGSAELFASGAVSILNGLGVSDMSFGSECSSLDRLADIAACLADEPPAYKEALRRYLSSGCSMPLARTRAYYETCGYETGDILSSPNNILAVEYMKALIRTSSPIVPHNIVRRDNRYHDDFLTGSISSATAIRKYMEAGDIEKVAECVNPLVYNILQSQCNKLLPVTDADFSQILLYALRDKTDSLDDYADVSAAMAVRIRNYISSKRDVFSLKSAADYVKTKDITYTRVCRSLVHILLGIRHNLISDVRTAGFPAYARVLAISASGREFLNSIRKTATIPVIANCHDDMQKSDDLRRRLLALDIKASDIYNDIIFDKYNNKIKDDYRSRPLIL